MKKLAKFSLSALFLASSFLSPLSIDSAQAAACATPAQSTTVETGTTFTVQTFSSVATNCAWTLPTGVTTFKIIIVGGGGGASFGGCAGGGGAGKVIISNSDFKVAANTTLTFTIGKGGDAGWLSSSNWVAGTNGDTSSATINGVTYFASGGGAGGGGNGPLTGAMGGSGGGGAACSSSNGGGADTSTAISGFTHYANGGAKGVTNGGGGGGAGAPGSGSSGGAGITLWGATFAGGGGGWSSGSGGSGGGGSAGSGTDTLANAGNAGTAGTGSGGGGGNAGGCGRIMVRYLVDTTINAPTISGTPYKGLAITITASANTPGVIRFYANGKRITNCLSKVTTGSFGSVTATCIWKPTVQGNVTLTATVTPTAYGYDTLTSASNKIFVLKRTTNR